ncbi:MAG: SDR family oxidoreductase [Gemmatimonadota bacterium]|jgi:NAD(P)-dependent dehydrogenase (short-subunit alcohol dehydrogenase family)
MRDGTLQDRVAIVTGGGSGIGRAIAVRFADAGARVAILDIDVAAAEAAAAEIGAAGGAGAAIACDVTSGASVRAGFDAAGERLGPLDILVTSAGVAHIGSVETTSEEDFDRVQAVNVKGVFLCLKAGVRAMRGRGGAILNIASVASTMGLADRFAYSASKGAVLTMTYSVARDCIGLGIRCNCVAPARVHTPFVDGFLAANYPGREEEMFEKLSATQPIGRMGKPEEVASLAMFLCSDEAAFITGSCFPIDGGFLTLQG